MSKKLKIFSLKILKGTGIKKKTKTFLNKGTKYEKKYMEGLISKNKTKILKVADPLQEDAIKFSRKFNRAHCLIPIMYNNAIRSFILF